MATDRRPSSVQRSFLAKVCEGRSVERYRKGQIVFSHGDTPNAVFCIRNGYVKVSVVLQQGKEAVLAILGANDFFGEGCLDGRTLRMTTVTTMTDSVIVRLEKAAIVRMIQQEPAFRTVFIGHLLRRTGRLEADLADHLVNSSEKRLARLLLLLAGPGRNGKPKPATPKINQGTLADMVGTTRSRVSFFMNKFRDFGFIDYDGGISSRIDVYRSLSNAIRPEKPRAKARAR